MYKKHFYSTFHINHCSKRKRDRFCCVLVVACLPADCVCFVHTGQNRIQRREGMLWILLCSVNHKMPPWFCQSIKFPRFCNRERNWRFMFSRPDKVPQKRAYREKSLKKITPFCSFLFNVKPVCKYLLLLFLLKEFNYVNPMPLVVADQLLAGILKPIMLRIIVPWKLHKLVMALRWNFDYEK